MLDPTGSNVEKVLDSVFLEFGLPKAIRSDNLMLQRRALDDRKLDRGIRLKRRPGSRCPSASSKGVGLGRTGDFPDVPVR
jgi:hypothetical protein